MVSRKRRRKNGANVRAPISGWGPKAATWMTACLAAMLLSLLAIAVNWGVALAVLSAALAFAIWRQARMALRERAGVQTRLDRLAADHNSVIEVLCGALGLQENARRAQSERVAHLASVLAWQMGLREEDVRLVRKAAVLHDIGKLGIAENVLTKPSELNEHEWAAMKRHPEVGYNVLDQIKALKDVAQVVHCHHERYDGQGYPRGLVADEIPLASRIFALIDSYVAMTTDRPYRKKMAHEMAVREIVRNSLTQFDPEVVQGFLEAERNGLLAEPNARSDGRVVAGAASGL